MMTSFGQASVTAMGTHSIRAGGLSMGEAYFMVQKSVGNCLSKGRQYGSVNTNQSYRTRFSGHYIKPLLPHQSRLAGLWTKLQKDSLSTSANPTVASASASSTQAEAVETGNEPSTSQTQVIRIFRTVPGVRAWRHKGDKEPKKIALVPTMGALHDGHLSLIRAAAATHSHIVVSIYVNPTQFGVNEDLSKYPRTFGEDMRKLNALNVELANEKSQDTRQAAVQGRVAAVFVPSTQEMYPSLPPTSEPAGHGSFVTITPIANPLEGASRPVFFRGVATICMKLFLIVRPFTVFFGEKDAQQLSLIRRMVKDFCMGIRVRAVKTEREANGLAMSSRNAFLGTRRREVASVLFEALSAARAQFEQGLRNREEILGPARRCLDEALRRQQDLPPRERALFELDYLSMADHEDMQEIDVIQPRMIVAICVAIRMLPVECPGEHEDLGEGDGRSRTIRLIDNVLLRPALSEMAAHMQEDIEQKRKSIKNHPLMLFLSGNSRGHDRSRFHKSGL